MKFYIDTDYKIHLSNPDNIYEEIEYDIDFFKDKCDRFIEGYRFVPPGRVWIRWDQVEFPGMMLAPWEDSILLNHYQADYMEDKIKDTLTALSLLGIS